MPTVGPELRSRNGSVAVNVTLAQLTEVSQTECYVYMYIHTCIHTNTCDSAERLFASHLSLAIIHLRVRVKGDPFCKSALIGKYFIQCSIL